MRIGFKQLAMLLFFLLLVISFSQIPPKGEEKPTVKEPFSRVLNKVIAVPESEFLLLIDRVSSDTTSPLSLKSAIEAAALANSSEAIGIVGEMEQSLHIANEDAILVMKDSKPTENGKVEATDYYVASIRIEGTVKWGLKSPRLLLRSNPIQSCEVPYRGCQPIPDNDLSPIQDKDSSISGIFDQLIFNVESSRLPINGRGRTVELLVYKDPKLKPHVSRFACAMPLDPQTCPKEVGKGSPVSSISQSFYSLPIEARLISESDFESLRRRYPLTVSDQKTRSLAAAAVSAANFTSAVGIEAKLTSENKLDTNFLVVARDIHLQKDIINATSFYIVPATLHGDISLLGANVRIGFSGLLPGIDFSQGVCGPVLIPGSGDICPNCFGPPQTWAAGFGGFGLDRQMRGMSRTSLRIPTKIDGVDRIVVAACSLFRPPKPPIVKVPGTLWTPEQCNGLDDNNNGKIDELACEILGCGTSTCQPRTCGTLRCVTIPDGCGQLLTCPCN